MFSDRRFLVPSLAILALASVSLSQPEVLTRAEATGYRETSRLRDVESFFWTLQRRSGKLLIRQIATSHDGRPVWMMILGDPPPANPRELCSTCKPAVYIEGNIHAGEVEGKEALQMLARDILLGDLASLLENQVLLFVPVLNPDGNEKISPEHRRNQKGPEGGVGVRANDQRLDLNRDFVKLESPEIRGVVGVLNEWDPILFVDVHTTNGSPHRHVVTYAIPHNPNTHPDIIRYLRDQLIPWVTDQMQKRYDTAILPYGNFRVRGTPDSGWVSFGPLARYGTNYVGLRNRFSILVENYAYAGFQQRVQGCYEFLRTVLEHTNQNAPQMQSVLQRVDAETRAKAAGSTFGIDFEPKPFPEPILLKSYQFKPDTSADGRVRWRPTEEEKEYRVPYYGRYSPIRRVNLPVGYLFPPSLNLIARKLRQHGITVLVLTDSIRVKVQRFRLTRVEPSEYPFQGHWLLSVQGEYQTQDATFPAGTFYVPTGQPLAPLVAWLLEPESPDGLLVWNFFDRYLRASEWSRQYGVYPVGKVLGAEAVPAVLFRE